MKKLTLLPTLAVAALVAAPAPSALAAATAHTYSVSIKGEQTTTWTYHGRTAGNCGGTTDGSGKQDFTFRSAPTAMTAAKAGGRTWVLGDGLTLHARGTRTGTFIQSANRCSPTPSPAPTSGCGSASWTLQAELGHGLDHPAERLNLDSDGAGVFAACPWFDGPTDGAYLDQGSHGQSTLRSEEIGSGLLLSFAGLSSKQLARGKSFSISKRTTRAYDGKDSYGRLYGQTVLRWTIHFRAKGR